VDKTCREKKKSVSNMKIVLLVGCAGFLGTVLRFLIVREINRIFGSFPLGTLVVNVIGAFIIGLLFVYCEERWTNYRIYFPLVFMGFLGAFTTFSSFVFDSVIFLGEGQYMKFALNIIVENVAGCLAVILGLWVGRTWI